MAKKVMIIDDDEGILEAFELILKLAGYRVDAHIDAEAVLKINGMNRPDVILLDVLLSGQDGRNICRQLKSDEETRDIPIIMVSAHPSALKEIEACGADDFLAKPFEMDELLKLVKKYSEGISK